MRDRPVAAADRRHAPPSASDHRRGDRRGRARTGADARGHARRRHRVPHRTGHGAGAHAAVAAGDGGAVRRARAAKSSRSSAPRAASARRLWPPTSRRRWRSSASGSTLLIDLHLAYGDAAVYLGTEPRFSVIDALENVHRLDKAFLGGLVGHARAGLSLLASSDRASATPVDSTSVRTLIESAARHYRYVVLDVPRTDVMIEALEPSSRIVIVANQELATVRAATRLSAALRQRYGKDRLPVVVSRFDLRSGDRAGRRRARARHAGRPHVSEQLPHRARGAEYRPACRARQPQQARRCVDRFRAQPAGDGRRPAPSERQSGPPRPPDGATTRQAGRAGPRVKHEIAARKRAWNAQAGAVAYEFRRSDQQPRDRPAATELSGAQGQDPQRPAEPPEPRAADADGAEGGRAGNSPHHPRDHRAQQRDDAAQPHRARDARRRRAQRALRPGPARSAAARSEHLGHPRQPLRSGLRRARWPARADRHRLPRRPAPDADHRAHRQHRRPPHRRVEPDGRRAGCGTARASTRSSRRSRSTGRRSRSGVSAPAASAPKTWSSAKR